MSLASERVEFDFTSSDVKQDPYPLLRRLREHSPVHFIPEMRFWLVTRYDDIRELFTDPRLSPDRRRWEFYAPRPEGSLIRWIDDNGLMAVSPADHVRQRKLLASGFTPRGVARMQGQIREVVARHAAPLAGRSGTVDVMAEFTTPIPNAVISAITGVAAPGAEEHRFSRLAQEAIQGFFGIPTEEILVRSERAFEELCGWVRATVAERRKEPREDLISDLVRARDGRDQLEDDEIVAQVAALLAAGSETTAIGGMLSITTLLDHPVQLERVRSDRSLIPQTVSEILRFAFGGIGGMTRYALEDFELHGQPIKTGQMVMLSLGGASHDAAHYADPDRFDIDRDPKDLLTFGVGPHFCLGSNLARGELSCMIDAALDFLPPGAVFLRDEAELQPMGMFDRPMTCPVDFGPGGAGRPTVRRPASR